MRLIRAGFLLPAALGASAQKQGQVQASVCVDVCESTLQGSVGTYVCVCVGVMVVVVCSWLLVCVFLLNVMYAFLFVS